MPGVKIFLKITFFFLASYVLLHIMALLGIFVAAGYLSWWFFAPQQTPCFYCMRQKKQGDVCRFCKPKRDTVFETLPLLSVLANVGGILVISAISVGVVLGEAKLLFSLNPFSAPEKTVTFLLPRKQEYTVGETFPMKVEITGIHQPINAVEADLSFDPKILQVVKIDTSNSFATIFVSRTYDNLQGLIHIVGGLPNPGFFEKKGGLVTVYFGSLSPGVGSIAFLPQSVVLANDGKGTDVLKDFPATQYFIRPASTQGTSPQPLSQRTGQSVLGASTINNERLFPLSLLYLVDNFIISFWRTVFRINFYK